MGNWFVGVDGGGTRTRAVVLDGNGREVARATGPAALADPREPTAAAARVAEVVGAAARAAGLSLPCTAVWAGIAGAGREEVRAAVEAALARTRVARTTRVGTDVEAAFHCAFEDGAGIVLVAGTGSVAAGRALDGREARVGGWGRLLGDEGSGYAIGLESLRRIARAEDGRGPGTRLGPAVLEHLGLEDAGALVGWAATAGKGDIAAMVPVVSRAAGEGDAVAAGILSAAAEELGSHLRALMARLEPWTGAPPRVALAGGLVGPGGPLRDALEATVAELGLGLVEREPDAALGAARLARAKG